MPRHGTGLLSRLIGRRREPDGRLVIHIGDFKTGSTAIQSWLAQASAYHGIGTPPGFNQADLAQLARDHAQDIATGRTDTPADAAFARLAEQVSAGTDPWFVLTAEHFEMTPPEALATLLHRHLPALASQVRVIAYIRPHPQAFLARLAESVKIGSHMGDMAGYLDRPDIPRRLAYGTRLQGWQTAFGNRLTVRLFDRRTLLGGDVRRDFAAFVTGEDPGALPHQKSANPTPGLRDLSRARALHRALGDLPPETQAARFTIGRAFGRVLAAADDVTADTPLSLDRALAERMVRELGAEARQADALFFSDAPLTRAIDDSITAAAATAPSLTPEDHLSPTAIAEIDRTGALLREAFLRPGGAEHITALWHE